MDQELFDYHYYKFMKMSFDELKQINPETLEYGEGQAYVEAYAMKYELVHG